MSECVCVCVRLFAHCMTHAHTYVRCAMSLVPRSHSLYIFRRWNVRFSVSSIVLCYYDSPPNAVYHTARIIFLVYFFPRFLCKPCVFLLPFWFFAPSFVSYNFLTSCVVFLPFLCSSSQYSVFFSKLNGLLLCWVYDLHVLSLSPHLSLSLSPLVSVFLCEYIYSMYETRCAVCSEAVLKF